MVPDAFQNNTFNKQVIVCPKLLTNIGVKVIQYYLILTSLRSCATSVLFFGHAKWKQTFNFLCFTVQYILYKILCCQSCIVFHLGFCFWPSLFKREQWLYALEYSVCRLCFLRAAPFISLMSFCVTHNCTSCHALYICYPLL